MIVAGVLGLPIDWPSMLLAAVIATLAVVVVLGPHSHEVAERDGAGIGRTTRQAAAEPKSKTAAPRSVTSFNQVDAGGTAGGNPTPTRLTAPARISDLQGGEAA